MAALVTAVLISALFAASVSAAEPAGEAQDAAESVVEAETPSEIIQTDISGMIYQEGVFSGSAGGSVSSGADTFTAQSISDYSEATFRAFEDTVIEAWNSRAESINISGLNLKTEDAEDLYGMLLNSHPEMFFVTGALGYLPNPYNPEYLFAFYPEYNTQYTQDDIAEFNSKVEYILSRINDNWSNVEKALFLHDWLVTHVQYDKTYSKRSAYDAIVEGSAVCQGYALAYKYLMNMSGIETDVVMSDAENHMWNLVAINGSYYHVDCTADDPTDGGGHFYEMYAEHTYFMKSQNSIAGTVQHNSTDWLNGASEPVYGVYADNTQFDSFFWNSTLTPIPYVGGAWVYYDTDASKIRKYDFSNGTDTVMAQFYANWPVWESPGYGWGNHFTSLTSYNGSIYVSDPSAVYTLTSAGEVEPFYQLSPEEAACGYIYGISAEGGQLRYDIATDYVDTNLTLRGYIPLGEPAHEHDLIHVQAVPATLSEYGNSEYWYCEGCGTYFADENAAVQIEENSWIIAPLPAKPTIITQPQDVSPVSGGNVFFSVEAEDAAAYQWQYSKDGGEKWFNSSATGKNTDTVTIASKTANYPNLYRCRLTGNDGKYVYTESAGFKDILKITRQPQTAVAGMGQNAVFAVEAENAVSYQWQYSKDGAKWYKSGLTGAAARTLSLTVSENNLTNLFRCKLADEQGSILYTETVGISLPPAVVIDVQPRDAYADIGNKAVFTVSASNAAADGYQWQYSKDGTKWYKSSASGADTRSISVTVSNSNKTNLYRCRLTGEDGGILYSDSAKVNVVQGLAIIEQPESVSAEIGSRVSFSVTAANVAEGGYQWYYSKDGNKWYKSSSEGAEEATLVLTVKSNNTTNLYRCKLTGTDGDVLYTENVGIITQ